MWNFFKKRPKITDDDFRLMEKVAESLINKYPYLRQQVSKEFLLDKKQNEFDPNTTTFILNANFESEYRNKLLPSFFLNKNILIRNKKDNEYTSVDIDILDGMLCGYKLIGRICDLDLDNIDISQVSEKHFKNEEEEELRSILGDVSPEIMDMLEITSNYKITIKRKNYYVNKSLGDGEYISIDKKGAIYQMNNDSTEIKLIYVNKENYFDEIGRVSR